MRTLELRAVPDEVLANLEVLAERDGVSLEMFAVRELARIASQADNAALLANLPSTDIDPNSIVEAIHAAREERDNALWRAIRGS